MQSILRAVISFLQQFVEQNSRVVQVQPSELPFVPSLDPSVTPLRLLKSTEKDRRSSMMRFTFVGDTFPKLVVKLQKKGSHKDVTEMFAKSLRLYETVLDERDEGNISVILNKERKPILRLA